MALNSMIFQECRAYHNTELLMASTVTDDGNLSRRGGEWWSTYTDFFPQKNPRFQAFKKDTGQSVHFALNWLQHSSLWSHIFFCCHSNAAREEKRSSINWCFKMILHASIILLKVNRKLRWAHHLWKALGRNMEKKKSPPESSSHCPFSEWPLHPQCYSLIFFWTRQWTVPVGCFFFFQSNKWNKTTDKSHITKAS